jgi:hypothetical protein
METVASSEEPNRTLPNGDYPVKELKILNGKYIIILPNDLMIIAEPVRDELLKEMTKFLECSTPCHIQINSQGYLTKQGHCKVMLEYPLVIFPRTTRRKNQPELLFACKHYQVVFTKGDILEQLL